MSASTARLLVLVVAALGASAALAAQRTFDRRIEAPPGGRLTFSADVGSVAIVGQDAQEVVIHAELQGSQSFLDHLHIDAGRSSSGVTVSMHGGDTGWLDWLDWFRFGSGRVRFTVAVPRDYPVDLRTSGGDVDVRNLNASLHAASSGGGAHLDDIAGAVNLHTSGGSIQAAHLAGSARLSSSGGGIDVSDSAGDLDLNTSGGGVDLRNDDGRIDAVTSGGGIRAQLRSNRGISLATSGGSITLLLPQGTGGSLDAESSGGGITSDFPVTTTHFAGDDHLAGTIGGGGAPISLHTSGGGIHIGPEH